VSEYGKMIPIVASISGGEWQKIALSRALFKGSNINCWNWKPWRFNKKERCLL